MRQAPAPTVSVNIQPSTHEDLDDIVDLERRSFPCPWRREYFATEIGAAFRFNLVARDPGGEFLGYVFCAFAGGELHVHKIAVELGWRRLGLAKLLMAEVIQFAQDIDAEEIFLEVRPSNTAARGLYENLGFRVAGRRRDYYPDGEDALVMLKLIQSDL